MRGLQFLLTRSVWLLTGTALLLLVFSLGLLIYGAWHHIERIRPLDSHLTYVVAIEAAAGDVRTQQINLLEAGGEPDSVSIAELREQLSRLQDSDAHRMKTTPAGIDDALTQLIQFDGFSRTPLDGASSALRGVLNQELLAHKLLVDEFRTRAQREVTIAVALGICMLIIVILLWSGVRRRILVPLNNLVGQMSLLARRDYSELPVDGTDPMLYPMIEKYNGMAQRLQTLERAQHQRQATLAREVRSASQLLLQQQRRLARAERLGAIGEVAAGVAHELRNPLTSVQMALDNLRVDLEDAELIQRVDMINAEVRRVTRQLNQLLDQARQRPEALTRVDIRDEVESLITLAGYQLSEEVAIRGEMETSLSCLLPPSQFRQVLLNLILNAGQAIGDQLGEILVQARRVETMLVISVKDSGPGFPRAMLDAGIQPFRSWRIDGIGLGLVMVRRFAQDLGGELLLSNNEEGGACSTLRLPYKQAND